MTVVRFNKNIDKISQRYKTLKHQLIFLSALLLILIVFLPSNSIAGEDEPLSSNGKNVGTTAAAFLEIGAGARAQAMGGAYTSISEDAFSMYWNPAGISDVSGVEVVVSHTNWIFETNYDYIGIVSSVGDMITIGANVTSFGVGDQIVRAVGYEEGTGEVYSAQDFAIGLSLAMNVTDRFSFGMNAKYIDQRIWHSSATGFAIDVGALYKTQLDGLQMGFSISNFGTNMQMAGRDLINAIDPDIINEGVDKIPVNYETGSFGLPMLFRFGVSYQMDFPSVHSKLLVATDLLKPNNSEESINIGLEYVVYDMVALRAGYKSLFLDEGTGGLSFGGGIIIASSSINLLIDYAYIDLGMLSSVHNFGINLKL
ncbi:MAG: PorV/PorQ family protein [Melioribacteraceae bacterium]|nr:PorV/PorQ family protein [Melioribacteraceae bacterium]